MKEISQSLSYREAVALQNEIREKIVRQPLGHHPLTVGGCDVSVTRKEDVAVASIVVMHFNTLEVLDEVTSTMNISFPYIPGLLAFREGPVVMDAFKKLKIRPELLIFDGHGICHPRGVGIASHMGIILQMPTMGCAKSHLFGDFSLPGRKRADFSWVRDTSGATMGIVLRTRQDVAPVYASPGHLTDFDDCLTILLHLSPRFRIPEPLRQAHHLCKTTRTSLLHR